MAVVTDVVSVDEDLRVAFGDPSFFVVPPGIMRYDHKTTHGWWVRIRRDRTNLTKFFSDGVCEGPDDALAQAIRFRHEIIEAFGFDTAFVHARSLPMDPLLRVHRKTDKPKRGHQPYEYWSAVWHDENHKRRDQSFSVKKYGEEGARALALDAATRNHNRSPKVTVSSAQKHVSEWKRESREEVARLSKQFIPYASRRDHYQRKEVLEVDPFGYEGGRSFTLHLAIERNKKLREKKLRQHLGEHGRLFCEICGFSFLETYPFLPVDIIQVHHVTPLSELTESTVTQLSDLMLLCANCHFVVHQGDAVEFAVLAMDAFQRSE